MSPSESRNSPCPGRPWPRNRSAAALACTVCRSRCIGAVVCSASHGTQSSTQQPSWRCHQPDLAGFELACKIRHVMCSATTAPGKVGSLRSQDIPCIDAGSARGALCGCCNPAPRRAALLPCNFSAGLRHWSCKLKIRSAARFSGPGWAFHPGARPTASHMGPIERWTSSV
jgi:hypothetical protein